jgi:hypothetical protein
MDEIFSKPCDDLDRVNVFDIIIEAVIGMMEDSFRKFKLGPFYQAMKNDLGKLMPDVVVAYC